MLPKSGLAGAVSACQRRNPQMHSYYRRWKTDSHFPVKISQVEHNISLYFITLKTGLSLAYTNMTHFQLSGCFQELTENKDVNYQTMAVINVTQRCLVQSFKPIEHTSVR